MKKLIISTSLLVPALKKLSQAVNKATVLPVLSNILLKATENQVVLIASDLEITIHYKLVCECRTEFECLVPFEFLSKIVALNKNSPITIESGKTLKIIGDVDVYEVKSPEKIKNYPALQELPVGDPITIHNDVLQCLHTALVTTSTNAKFPTLALVLLELSEGKITVASTDGSYIAFSKEFNADIKEAQELLLSAKVIKVLEGSQMATLTFSDKVIGFQAIDITIIITRSEGKFVNFRKVFPPEWPANLTIDRHLLLEALGKCAISSDQLRTTQVDLSTPGEMKLLADDNIVKINVSLQATYSGQVPSTQINSDKLMKLLHQVEYPEISFAIHDKNRAIVLSSTQDSGYLGMIMPIAQMN